LITAAAGFGTAATGGAGAFAFAWVPAAIAGGSQLAMLALDELTKKSPGKAERKNSNGYAREGDRLSAQGLPIPMIFCYRQEVAANEDYHPEGGCYVEKMLLNQYIECTSGRTWLHSIYLLAAGQAPGMAYGAISEISEGRDIDDDKPQLLVNGQPLDNYNNGWSIGESQYQEIDIDFRRGVKNQPVYADFSRIYSQIINPQDLNEFGIDYKVKLTSTPTIVAAPNTNIVAATVTGKKVRKTLTNNAWNSGVFGSKQVRRNQWFQFSPVVFGARVAAGLSNNDTDQSASSIKHGFILLLASNEAQVTENGNIIPLPPIYYTTESLFVVRWTDDDQIQYEVDGVIVYTSAIAPVAPLYPDIALWSNGAGLDRVRTTKETGGLIDPSGETTISFTVDDEDRLNPYQRYIAEGGCYGVPMQILAKKDQSGADLFSATSVNNSNVSNITNGSRLYSYSDSRWSTISRVNRLDLLFRFYLYRRNKDNELNTKGMLFDIYIRPVPKQGVGWKLIARIFAKGEAPDYIYRMFSIRNLPLGNYRLKIEPLICDPGGMPIWELDDSGNTARANTGVTIFGREIVCHFEGTIAAQVESLSFDDDLYPQVSTQEQVPGTLVSINQVIEVGGRNEGVSNAGNNDNLVLPSYPNLATMRTILSDSRHLGQSVLIDPYINKGSEIPNLMAAGNAFGGSAGNVLIGEDHSAIAKVGWILRNLKKRKESGITAIAGGSITTATALDWEQNDPYLIFFIAPSAYLPDVFAHLIRTPWGGIPRNIDPDLGVDYWSLVKSRAFCKKNRYFWDDSINETTGFYERMEKGLPGSLLMPYQPDGRIGMLPDEQAAPKVVLNQDNIKNYAYDYDSKTHPYNRVQVNYRDGRMQFDRQSARHQFSEIIFETYAVWKGNERPHSVSMDYPANTRKQQTVDVVKRILRSYIIQRPTISFSTDYRTLEAAGMEIGDVMSVSHCWTAINDLGGMAKPSPGGFRICGSGNKGNAAQYRGLFYVPSAAKADDRVVNKDGAQVATILTVSTEGLATVDAVLDEGSYSIHPALLRSGVSYFEAGGALLVQSVTEIAPGLWSGAIVPGDGAFVNIDLDDSQSSLWRLSSVTIQNGICACQASKYSDRLYEDAQVGESEAAYVMTADNVETFWS
jgi:hypothetical protein